MQVNRLQWVVGEYLCNISTTKIDWVRHWISGTKIDRVAIYPMHNALHPLNNWGVVAKRQNWKDESAMSGTPDLDLTTTSEAGQTNHKTTKSSLHLLFTAITPLRSTTIWKKPITLISSLQSVYLNSELQSDNSSQVSQQGLNSDHSHAKQTLKPLGHNASN